MRSRAEALTVRASLASKSFTLSSSETSPGSIVSDTIRRMDFECFRFSKLIATLPSHVDSTGLSLPEADMLLMLLKSLPISVRDYSSSLFRKEFRIIQIGRTSIGGAAEVVSGFSSDWFKEDGVTVGDSVAR